MNTFSGSACIRAGWETFKKRPWFFIGITVLVAAISGIAGQFTSAGASQAAAAVIIVGAGYIISFIVSMFVKMGTINVFLKAQGDASSVRFEDLWVPQHIITFTLATLLVGIITVVGLILLIVPGIIWALRYFLVQYLIMDRGLDVSAALKESARITMGHKWQLLGFLVLLGLLNLLGAILLLVGLLVTIPVTGLATVEAYRSLSKTA